MSPERTLPSGNIVHTSSNSPEDQAQQASLWQRAYRSTGARIAAGALVAAGVGTTLGLELTSGSGPNTGDADAALTANAYTNSELAQALTINLIPSADDCSTIVEAVDSSAVVTSNGTTVITPHIGANDGLVANGDGGTRLFSDSLEAPLPDPSNAQESLQDIDSTICRDPLFASTLANEFANMDLDGVQIVDLNSWLQPYNFDASAPENMIATEAASYFGQPNAQEQISETVDSNQQYQQFAEKLIVLLSRFQNLGEGTNPTSLNYVLSGGDLVAGNIPQVYLNPQQYNADAIWLVLTKKTGGCYVQIGFNVGDQRPEETNVCEAVPTPTTVPTPIPMTPPKHTTVTTPGHFNTTTTVPGTTTTAGIGPKGPAHPPVPGGEPTTIPQGQPEGGPIPTTSTTTSTSELVNGSTTTTTNGSVTTTSAAGPCGEACDN